MLRIHNLMQSRMFIRASSAANIGLALKHSHALPCPGQSSRRSKACRPRPDHNHVTLFSSAHEPIRLRTAIAIPCARIISFLGVGTLTRSENTS